MQGDAEEQGDKRAEGCDLGEGEVHEDDLALHNVDAEIGEHAHHEHAEDECREHNLDGFSWVHGSSRVELQHGRPRLSGLPCFSAYLLTRPVCSPAASRRPTQRSTSPK